MPERAPDSARPPQPEAGPSKQGLAEDYAALEATLRDTPLGRWFLAEYARRNRSPETDMLLDAIARLETAVLKPQRQSELSSVVAELVKMSEAIARTRREIAQLRPPHRFDKHLTNASGELDQIVEATEAATSEILSAAEDVQEIAWTLRERGIALEFCDRLDHRAIDIYTACSFQDITGQRTAKVVRTLRLVEKRINAMIEIWGVDDIASRIRDIGEHMEQLAREEAQLLDGPQNEGEGLEQHHVDDMLAAAHPAEADQPAPSAGAPQGEGFERPEPLTLDKLHGVKRSALFG